MDLQKVHRKIEVNRREVRESVSCRLVRDRVRVTQVFDGQRAASLGFLQKRHGVGLRHKERPRQIVDLDALSQEVTVAGGLSMAQDAASQ